MTQQEQELIKQKDEIKSEVKAIFKANMKIFDWDIPENDEDISAKMIISAIEEALNEIKSELKESD
jgi:hypothetical protein